MTTMAPTETITLTPFDYAWQLLTAPYYFYSADVAENRQRALAQQEMALRLNQYARMQPFEEAPSQPDIVLARGLDACIHYGFGALAADIFRNYDGSFDNMGDLARHLAILQVPERAIRCPWAEGAPLISYLFEEVGITFAQLSPDLTEYSQPLRPTNRWFRRLMQVAGGEPIPVDRTNVVTRPPSVDNFFVAFHALLKRDLQGFIQDELVLARAFTDDDQRWGYLGKALQETSRYPELSHLPSLCLRQAINRGSRNTQLRQYLVYATNAIQDGTALRFAIRHRDNSTFCLVIDVLRATGQSLDAKISEDTNVRTHRKPPVEFYDTPLTWALHENNYHQAAKLLMLGADPKLVAVNITNRVRTLRWIINQDPLNFPYEQLVWNEYDGNDDVTNDTRRNVMGQPEKSASQRRGRTVYEINYVFRRLLDDPNLPLLPSLDVDLDNLSVHDEDWEFDPMPRRPNSGPSTTPPHEPASPNLVSWFRYNQPPTRIRRSDVLAPVPHDTQGMQQNIDSILAKSDAQFDAEQMQIIKSIQRGNSDARNRARAERTPNRRKPNEELQSSPVFGDNRAPRNERRHLATKYRRTSETTSNVHEGSPQLKQPPASEQQAPAAGNDVQGGSPQVPGGSGASRRAKTYQSLQGSGPGHNRALRSATSALVPAEGNNVQEKSPQFSSNGPQFNEDDGTVVRAGSSSGRKPEFNGESFDYVFTITIAAGGSQPYTLQLPYNLDEDPLARAQYFINYHDLSPAFADQIAEFIVDGIDGKTPGQGPAGGILRLVTADNTEGETLGQDGSGGTLQFFNRAPVFNEETGEFEI
ncbi:hypothetical protein GGR57DRAFT_452706 [Xylariaceae sp. FL1272]|nr:hypothetical protein GGR57DRAFT_452706 [Xylariaceae sp. FL1272]